MDTIFNQTFNNASKTAKIQLFFFSAFFAFFSLHILVSVYELIHHALAWLVAAVVVSLKASGFAAIVHLMYTCRIGTANGNGNGNDDNGSATQKACTIDPPGSTAVAAAAPATLPAWLHNGATVVYKGLWDQSCTVVSVYTECDGSNFAIVRFANGEERDTTVKHLAPTLPPAVPAWCAKGATVRYSRTNGCAQVVGLAPPMPGDTTTFVSIVFPDGTSRETTVDLLSYPADPYL